MATHFTFRHVEPSDGVKSYAQKKFEKVTKILPSILDVHFIFEVNKQQHKVEITLHSAQGHFIAHHVSDNMYASIDFVVDKIVQQVNKEKEKHERR